MVPTEPLRLNWLKQKKTAGQGQGARSGNKARAKEDSTSSHGLTLCYLRFLSTRWYLSYAIHDALRITCEIHQSPMSSFTPEPAAPRRSIAAVHHCGYTYRVPQHRASIRRTYPTPDTTFNQNRDHCHTVSEGIRALLHPLHCIRRIMTIE